MKGYNHTKDYPIDYMTIIISITLLAALVFLTIISPDLVVKNLVSARDFVIYYMGSFFMVFVAGMLFYNIWLAFSKYGNIRLGKIKPQYSTFGLNGPITSFGFVLSAWIWRKQLISP